MKLTVLGCSGSLPGPDSPASAYLVEAEGYRLVLDLGQGAFGRLIAHTEPADVDTVLVTHLHADHCLDLTAYVVALRYGHPKGYLQTDPTRRIGLIGPAGTRDRVEAAYDPWARKLSLHELFTFDKPVDGELGPFRVSYAPMNHPVPTYAVRLEHEGRSLVYSGDTGVSPELVGLARDADVLLCEATFGPDVDYIPDLHLTGRQAGEHAAEAGVGTLLVTHVPPWASREVAAAEAGAVFDGTIEAVAPDSVYEI